jgi:hypothetical protein
MNHISDIEISTLNRFGMNEIGVSEMKLLKNNNKGLFQIKGISPYLPFII